MLITPAVDEANTLSIFGVAERLRGRDVVDDGVVSKRVDGFVFNFFNAGEGKEAKIEAERLRRARMSAGDRESK